MQTDKSIKNYLPLIAILMVISLSSLAISERTGAALMPISMGLFLVIFAMLKLIDLENFAKGFGMYDAVTKKYPAYGKIYPFIELALGLLYLSGFFPMIASLATIVVMSIAAYGVLRALKKGSKVKCACLGTAINVALSTVSLFENLLMVAMAAIGLIRMASIGQ